MLCCLSSAKLRQHSIIHQARNYDASYVIVSGLVYQTADDDADDDDDEDDAVAADDDDDVGDGPMWAC